MSRKAFLALVLAQAAHSVEEYLFRLFDVFPPARFVSRLFDLSGRDLAAGFVVANATLVLFGLWCYLARVRAGHPAGRGWAWSWTILEAANGTVHLLLALGTGGYFPGAYTAPVLLAVAAWLGWSLTREQAGHTA